MLGLINENNLYTNLGLLLSDQCPYTIKMAIYSDNTKREFIDQKETREGSVLAQIEEAENYLKLINRVAGKIQGMERIDTYDYPPEGIRELILNTVGHRLSEASDNRCYEKKKIMRSWTKKAFFYGLFSLFNFS